MAHYHADIMHHNLSQVKLVDIGEFYHVLWIGFFVSGLYVLASEPAEIPWFDGVFADIGDEQSLAQSLSTFSGHLKQISVTSHHFP